LTTGMTAALETLDPKYLSLLNILTIIRIFKNPKELLCEPKNERKPETLTRNKLTYTSTSKTQFHLPLKEFEQQFSELYIVRTKKMKPILIQQASKKWPNGLFQKKMY